MKLQTQIPLKKRPENLIDYNANILLLGSCFSNNIGDKLDYYKFKSLQNPFGVLFHPKAIETLLIHALKEKKYTASDVFFHNELWHCLDTHSKYSNPSKEALLVRLNKQIQVTNEYLKKATHIVITLGTAWVYRFIEQDRTVANCHKLPQKQFTKKLLYVNEIEASLQNILNQIKAVNKKAVVLFTVSPVRHIKDGFVENMQSKAHLITAIHKLNKPSFYFPSYEIMMDELRDYRFYKEDMIHPNPLAINYIWQCFTRVWFLESTLEVMEAVNVVQKGLRHRSRNPNSKSHQKFLKNIKDKVLMLKKEYPHMKFDLPS